MKAKFLELCPSSISEKEFWTEFFQSHYFHRDRFATSGKVWRNFFFWIFRKFLEWFGISKFLSKFFKKKFQDKNIFEACDKDEATAVLGQSTSDFLVLDAIFDEQSIVPPESQDQIDLALEKAKLKDKKRKQNLTQKEVNFKFSEKYFK